MRPKHVHRLPPRANTYREAEPLDDAELVDGGEWRLRFGMRGLLLLMVIASVVFAGLGYLLHALRGGGRGFHLAFVLFTLVGPMALLALFSIGAWLLRRTERGSAGAGDAGARGRGSAGADEE